MEDRLVLSTYLVTATSDAGPGSLRQAILDSDGNPGATNTIAFNIPSAGVQTILPLSALPAITVPTILDGTTQPGYTNSPLIELCGTNAGPNTPGLLITAGNSTVRGLIINSFTTSGIDIQQNGGDLIAGNYIGTDATGTIARGNSLVGIVTAFNGGVGNNVIGGTTAADRNIIAGNLSSGVDIGGAGNVVEGNYIGTDVTGTYALGNAVGVFVDGEEGNNTIGGTTPGAGNVISGNRGAGVEVNSGNGGNVVLGNFLGTNATGTAALGNDYGVLLLGAGNTIGGTTVGARNIISSNRIGIEALSGAVVQGNYIGTDVTGTLALGNSQVGILGGGTIGGTAPGARNVISGNGGDGIDLSTGGTVQGNYIGTAATGTLVLGNLGNGIRVIGGGLIGGPGAGNVISGNGGDGLLLAPAFFGLGSATVQGNSIGTDVTGTLALGNAGSGVHVASRERGSGSTIGGSGAGLGNTIAFNSIDGVLLESAAGNGNAIRGNSIFANTNLGIELLSGANNDQASPSLTSAVSDGTSTTVQGTLTSTPNTTFSLEFFANPSSSSGSSEGQNLLGSVTVTTDATGQAAFTATLTIAVVPGIVLTATATDLAGNTSVFSPGIVVTTSSHAIQSGQTKLASFWNSSAGQALIRGFNGSAQSTALANWLAATFPNLAGDNAGGDDLSGLSNTQLATVFQMLYAAQSGSPTVQFEVQLLTAALNLYATTQSLGGAQGAGAGFLVTTYGLGASTFDVGTDGAAFGIADGSTLNVLQLLTAVDAQANSGVPYPGHSERIALAADLFMRLNQAGN